MPKNIATVTAPAPLNAALSPLSRKHLTPSQWDSLAMDVCSGIDTALSGRATFDQNLEDANDLYEGLVDEEDVPYPGGPNIFVPLIPTQVDALCAYIANKALVPHFYLVKPFSMPAAGVAPRMERYYINELYKQRGDTTWFKQQQKWLQLSVRDGIAYMEPLWKYRKTRLQLISRTLRLEQDPQTQQYNPAFDEHGDPIYDAEQTEADDIYDDVEWTPVSARDLIKLPADARSVHTAAAVIRNVEMYEQDLKDLGHGIVDSQMGEFDFDILEDVLNYKPHGEGSASNDQRQPNGVRTAGRNLDIGLGQGTQASEFFANRGPFTIQRVHSKQYDLDRDGTPEENIFWIYLPARRLIGWCRYQYLVTLGGPSSVMRPFIPLAVYERPDMEEGFGVPWRLAGLQNETNKQRQQRLAEGDIRIRPPWWERRGANIDSDGFSWGPNQKVVSDQFDDLQRMEQHEIPQQAWLDENILKSDASEFTGLSSMTLGQPRPGKPPSAAQSRFEAAATSVRLDALVMNFRLACRTLIQFTHELKKSHLPKTPITFMAGTLPQEIQPDDFKQNFIIDVAGASDPIDASERRMEALEAYELFQRDPAIAQNPMRMYYLRRKVAAAFDWADADQIIGTEQEAAQEAQALQAQRQTANIVGALGAAAGHAANQQQQLQEQAGAPGGGAPVQQGAGAPAAAPSANGSAGP